MLCSGLNHAGDAGHLCEHVAERIETEWRISPAMMLPGSYAGMQLPSSEFPFLQLDVDYTDTLLKAWMEQQKTNEPEMTETVAIAMDEMLAGSRLRTSSTDCSGVGGGGARILEQGEIVPGHLASAHLIAARVTRADPKVLVAVIRGAVAPTMQAEELRSSDDRFLYSTGRRT